MRSSLFILSLSIGLLFETCGSWTNQKLPILGNREVVEQIINGKTIIDTIYQNIPSFYLTNQYGLKVSNKDFDHSIYVADFFFTSCNSICPIMHQNMLQVYHRFKNDHRVKFLSHSIDIEQDNPSVLKKYAEKLGLDGLKWQFTCSSKDSIYNILAKSYLVAAYEDSSDPQGKVHQGWFILVDPKKHIRGAYDGTKKTETDRLMADMETLLREFKDL